MSEDDDLPSGDSPTQTVPKSPPTPPQNTSLSNEKAKKEANGKGRSGQTGNGEETKVITGKIESIPDSEFEKGRLATEDITKQFPNYNVGTPCKVCLLYILLAFIFFSFCNQLLIL